MVVLPSGTGTGIGALPNEILITILSSFSTRALLSITPTSQRFHSLIIRILHARLLNASSLKAHTLILECFHPSTKLSTPYLFCESLGTGSADSISSTSIDKAETLGSMHGLYSHFRPLQPEEDRKIRRPHPAGGWATGPSNTIMEKQTAYVSQNIHLESHELFSQLCTITNLVKVGPKRGLFLSCVNIGEGITRVWRNWLAERCASLKKRGKLGSGPNTKAEEDEEYEKRLLWADTASHVGLRLRVIEKEDDAAPILLRLDEDPPVSYTLQYEELVIRTTQLLLKVEQSLDQEVNHSGMLCGLDGVFLPESYNARLPGQSWAEFWRPAVEAFSGGVYAS